MASFSQQRPRQFNNYIPEVDSQVYAQALAKKDTEYQLGVQKVESYRNNIAGIPVAFEHERKYLQGVTNDLTTQINQMVGADWSDQKLVNQIGNHASTIYNDENIQTAISNASVVREQQNRMKEDEKRSKGSNIANRYVYLEQLNNFSKNGKVGESFSGGYNTYFDKQKYIDDLFSKKHPNQEVRFEFAGFDEHGNPRSEQKLYEWDAIKHTWKGLKSDELAREMQELISTSPELETQLAIDAKYKYKDYNAVNYGQDIKEYQLSAVDRDTKLYADYITELSKYKQGEPEYLQINAKLEELQADAKKRLNYIANGLEEDMYKYHTDPNFRDSQNNRLYKDKWLTAQANFYSYGENNTELIGDSPRKAWYEKQKLAIENRKLANDEKQKSFENYMAKLKYEDSHRLTDAKIQKLTGTGEATIEGMNSLADMGIDMKTQTKMSPSEKTKIDLIDLDNDINNQKYKYMYDVLGKYSNDMFIKDANGNYVPANNNAKNVIDRYYNDLRKAYDNGGQDDEGRTLINQSDRDFFSTIAEKEVDKDLTIQSLKRGEELWKKEITNNPKLVALESKVESFAPIKINDKEVITKDDIRKFARLEKQAEEFAIKNQSPEVGISKEDARAEFYKRNGISEAKIRTFYNNKNVSTLVDELAALPKSKTEFLDKHVLGGADEGIIYTNQQSKGLFGKDPKVNNVLKRNIIQIAARMGDKYKVLASDPNKFQLAYTQDPVSKKFSILVQDPTKDAEDQLDPIPLTNNEVANLRLEDITTPHPVLSRISKNWDAGKNTGNPKDGGMTFRNSLPTGVVTQDININKGNPTEIKYGVEYKSTGFYVSLYGKDLVTGKENLIKQLPKQKDWGTAEQKLNQLLKRNQPTQSTGYIIDPTILNNTNQNLTELEDDTQSEE